MAERTLVIGAAGQMASTTVRALVGAGVKGLVLADRDSDRLEALVRELPRGHVESTPLDLFDVVSLTRALDGVGLVINGAGPFYKTGDLVMRAAIAAGTSYIDIADDVESALVAIDLDLSARERGVSLYVGHGASPGFTNVLAADARNRLDRVKTLEVAWCVSDDGTPLGYAVAEHIVHIGAGRHPTWRGGARTTEESFTRSLVFPLAAPFGDYRLYDCAHPEPVMLGHSFPDLSDVICWGGLHPAPLNGLVQGISRAVRAGRLSMDRACDLLVSSTRGDVGPLSAWFHATGGMLRQIAAGETTVRALLAQVVQRVGLRHAPAAIGGMGARARGERDGRPGSVLLQIVGIGTPTTNIMGAFTGLSMAAAVLLMKERPGSPGLCFPETWIRPTDFYRQFNDLARHHGFTVEVRSFDN